MTSAPVIARKQEPGLSREEIKQRGNKVRKIVQGIETQEAIIADLENRIAALETDLGKPENFSRQGEMLNQYQKLESELKKEMVAWENLQMEMEVMKQ